MKTDQTLLVLGARGMLGRALVERLEKQGRRFRAVGRAELDLTNQAAVDEWFAGNEIDAVYLAAAK